MTNEKLDTCIELKSKIYSLKQDVERLTDFLLLPLKKRNVLIRIAEKNGRDILRSDDIEDKYVDINDLIAGIDDLMLMPVIKKLRQQLYDLEKEYAAL